MIPPLVFPGLPTNLFSRRVRALEQPRFREDEELEGVLDSAEVANVDDCQAVELVQTGVLKPESKSRHVIWQKRNGPSVTTTSVSWPNNLC